jgi:hypothetical protein
VLAKVLLVDDLEPGVLGLGDDPARARQLPVREDVAVEQRLYADHVVFYDGDAEFAGF